MPSGIQKLPEINPQCTKIVLGGTPWTLKMSEELINTLMGKKAELRFRFIQENAAFVEELDI